MDTSLEITRLVILLRKLEEPWNNYSYLVDRRPFHWFLLLDEATVTSGLMSWRFSLAARSANRPYKNAL